MQSFNQSVKFPAQHIDGHKFKNASVDYDPCKR